MAKKKEKNTLVLPTGFNNYTPEEKEAYLSDNCDKVATGKYFQHLSEEELAEVQRSYSDKQVALRGMKEEFKEVSADWKGRIKTAEEENNHSLTVISQRGEHKDGKTFQFHFHEEGVVREYDIYGNHLTERKMHDEERQTTIQRTIRSASKPE
jgi:hypothetical protein